MKTSYIIKSTGGKHNSFLMACTSLLLLCMLSQIQSAYAQAVLFDFDNAPQYTSLPIDQTVSGITAHFSATAQGYSIQAANTMGFTPVGFGGNCIYPNSVYLSDLLISFDQTITDFSIMYACQELGCDDAATMRVTAYMNSSYIGTNTRTATFPGTWPSDTLSCSFIQGFNNVEIHYDHRPPTCQDYGVIYLADNMRVTAFVTTIENPETIMKGLIVPNPVSQSTTVLLSLLQSRNMHVAVYDIAGRLIKSLFDGNLSAGEHWLNWDVKSDAISSGVYYLNFNGENFSHSIKLVVIQ